MIEHIFSELKIGDKGYVEKNYHRNGFIYFCWSNRRFQLAAYQ
jgi:hypothetical protein